MFSFGKQHKLLKTTDYKDIFISKLSHRLHSKYWQIIYKTASDTKLGVIVAKKHHKLAVNRNKIKRIIRELFRLSKTQLHGFNIIVISKKFNNVDNKKLNNDLYNLFLKVN